jgi:ribosomal protein S18 acetylase RimI-like enzyme
VPLPEHIHRFWRALDDLLGRVQPTWWGAVVTDARFPRIWDANYARIDIASEDLRAADVEAELLPALAEAGASVMHVVMFHPDETRTLLSELSTRGHRIGWDLAMDLVGDPATDGQPDQGVLVEELSLDQEVWSAIETSMALFGIEGAEAIAQLLRLEEEVLVPGGRRWFGVRDPAGDLASLAALIELEGVGYIDNVATVPAARGRGYASALTTRLSREALEGGSKHVCLLVDPDSTAAVRMYERLAFRGVGRLGSTKGPIPTPGPQPGGGIS